MHDYSTYRVGEQQELLQLDSWEKNRTIALLMAQQCHRNLDIISRQLDPPLFNNPEFLEALHGLIGEGHRPRVRIIVLDPKAIVSHGHLLVDFVGKHSSFIEMRKASEEFQSYNEFLLVADEIAWLHRNSAARYEAEANFNDRRQSRLYLDKFSTMWNLAAPDANLRSMKL